MEFVIGERVFDLFSWCFLKLKENKLKIFFRICFLK